MYENDMDIVINLRFVLRFELIKSLINFVTPHKYGYFKK